MCWCLTKATNNALVQWFRGGPIGLSLGQSTQERRREGSAPSRSETRPNYSKRRLAGSGTSDTDSVPPSGEGMALSIEAIPLTQMREPVQEQSSNRIHLCLMPKDHRNIHVAPFGSCQVGRWGVAVWRWLLALGLTILYNCPQGTNRHAQPELGRCGMNQGIESWHKSCMDVESHRASVSLTARVQWSCDVRACMESGLWSRGSRPMMYTRPSTTLYRQANKRSVTVASATFSARHHRDHHLLQMLVIGYVVRNHVHIRKLRSGLRPENERISSDMLWDTSVSGSTDLLSQSAT